jgi:glyoxylase I family protein
MLKIAVFGLYGPDQGRTTRTRHENRLLPVNTTDFMRIVWQIEPPESRIGGEPLPNAPNFVKLTQIADQPIYVQSVSNHMAPGAALLQCDGYVAIIDARMLASATILTTLRRLAESRSSTHLMIAAGRQNEPEALSSDEIRHVLKLHPDLPIYPYIPGEPKTVHRLIKRLARYITDPHRVVPPIFAGDCPPPRGAAAPPENASERTAQPAAPRIHGLAHVSITVHDLPRALEFYQGLLGFRLMGHLDVPDSERGLTITHLDTGRGVLELFSYAHAAVQPCVEEEETRAGLQHVALGVTGLDAIVAQLSGAGVPITYGPTDFAGGVRIAFLTDPDGTSIELIEGNMVYTRR